MVIGIIGAGLSGLVAGQLLARAGHEVTILEKGNAPGGRMASRIGGKNSQIRFDIGISHFYVESPEFREFVNELSEQKIIRPWGSNISFYDGEKILDRNPYPGPAESYTAAGGMESIGTYLSRWVDVRYETWAGGITNIGKNRKKKRAWMINLTAGNTFEADAILIATPAPQAYGLLQTTTDEINILKIIRQIDEVHYKPAYSLLVEYAEPDCPSWEGLTCQGNSIEFISNESSKQAVEKGCSLVIHAGESFSREHRNSDETVVIRKLLNELATIVGDWATSPQWHRLHFWRFRRALKTLDMPFFDYEDSDSPLALVGDYFEGNTLDHAYRSGYKLAKHWLEK